MIMDAKEDFMCSILKLLGRLSTEILLTFFIRLYYNDGVTLPDANELEGAFVKLIVEQKSNYAKFDHTVKELQDMSLGDLKIVEDLGVELEGSNSVMETEDTMTLLDNYIDGIDLKANKSNIKSVMRSLYIEAAEL